MRVCADIRASISRAPDAYGAASSTRAFGRIYAIGGWTANGSYSNEVDVYDPGVNSWTTVANLPVSRGGRAAVAGSDGRIYAFGGVDSSGIASPNVYAYAPAPMTPVLSWTPSGSLTYDNVLTTSQLDATASVAGKQVTGNFSYRDGTTQVTAGTVLSAGVHQLVATYTTSNPNIVSGGTVTATIYVAQAAPTVSVLIMVAHITARRSQPLLLSTDCPASRVQLRRWIISDISTGPGLILAPRDR